ncbi:MAG: hypothetical protein J2P22_01425 [Nocardioides sp.]|nr:hypothetical protein [Nocardioides sp.]
MAFPPITPLTTTPAAHPLGIKWTSTISVPYLRQVSGGATWNEVEWCEVEPRQGRWDWHGVDNAVQQARALGYTMMLKIRIGTCWITGGTPTYTRSGNGNTESRMPKSLSAYQDFVHAVVSRYAPMGVHEYAIENEPNAANFWAGTVDELLTLTRTAVGAIRGTDPRAQVASWGIASEPVGVGVISRLVDEGDVAQAIATYDAYFAHRGTYPRVTSGTELRHYLSTPRPRLGLELLQAEQQLLAQHVFDVRQVHFYESWQAVPALMSYLRATTPHSVPIEVWEAGQLWLNHPTSNDRVRSDQAIKTIVLMLAGGASRIVWLPLAFPRHGTEYRFGLLAPGPEPRVAADAYRRLVRWTSDLSRPPVAAPGWRGAAFPHGSATWLVVWNDHGATVNRPTGTTVNVTDLSGHRVSWASSGLRVGPDPLFVKIDARPSRALAMFE